MEWVPNSIDAITNLVKELGAVEGLFILFFVIAHIVLFMQYRGRLADRQGEIDRLAEENRQYRMRFLRFLDDKYHVGEQE